MDHRSRKHPAHLVAMAQPVLEPKKDSVTNQTLQIKIEIETLYRSSPIGGFANGIPLKAKYDLLLKKVCITSPRIAPFFVSTIL